MVDLKAEAMTPLLHGSAKLPQCTGEEHIRLKLLGIYSCLDYWLFIVYCCISVYLGFPACKKRLKICVSLCKATQDALLESIAEE